MADRGNRLYRLIDFWAGVPLVFLFGLFRKRKKVLPTENYVSRIAILATAAIGDTILMSAVLADLREKYPGTELFLFTGSSNMAIAEMICPGYTILRISVSRPLKSIRGIRRMGYFDIWLDFGPWPRINALFTAASRSCYTVGFRTPGQYRHFIYDNPVLHRNDCHELENLRALVAATGVKSNSIPMIEPLWNSDKHGDYTVIHMFPGGYKSHFKEWSRKNWLELIKNLTSRGYPVIITGAPENRIPAEDLVSECSDSGLIRNKAGDIPLKDLPEILREARLVISVNTGIMHMAAACGSPLIALHGPTSVLRWGPVSERAVNIQATSPSAGILNLGFEYDRKDPRSMDTISPLYVFTEALKILDE